MRPSNGAGPVATVEVPPRDVPWSLPRALLQVNAYVGVRDGDRVRLVGDAGELVHATVRVAADGSVGLTDIEGEIEPRTVRVRIYRTALPTPNVDSEAG